MKRYFMADEDEMGWMVRRYHPCVRVCLVGY